MTLNEMQRIKLWLASHRDDHPVEYHLWDGVLSAHRARRLRCDWTAAG